jgi:beta-phosphoglucomutase
MPTIMALTLNEIGFIFDLDGVLVDTAKLHYQAWRRLANSLGFDFSEQQNEELKGVGRIDSLNKILSWGGISMNEEDKVQAATQKNEWYNELIAHLSNKDALPGALEFLDLVRSKDIKIALGSASKNAYPVLKSLGIVHYFDAIVDGNALTHNKPHPEVFLKGAIGLNLPPTQCAVFEDAEVGIEAALTAGMVAIGIGTEDVLPKAQLNFLALQDVDINLVISLIHRANH